MSDLSPDDEPLKDFRADDMPLRYEAPFEEMPHDQVMSRLLRGGSPETRGPKEEGTAARLNRLLETLHRGVFYPPTVASRYMDPGKTDPFYHPPKQDMFPEESLSKQHTQRTLAGIGALSPPNWQPGTRESSNVDDRSWRPGQSIWKW